MSSLAFELLGYYFFAMSAVWMAVMDGISFRGLFKGHKFWGKIGWKNKYKNYPTDQRAKFIGSKTVFVFLTDGWHLSQFFMLTFFALSAVDFDRSTQHIAIEFIILRILFSAVFSFLFDYLFTKKINVMNEMKIIIAKWLSVLKLKSPIVFVAVVGSLYGYTFLLDPTAITDWGLALFHKDMNDIPYHEVISFLTNSKFATGAILALVGGHTTGILKAAKDEKKTS